VDYAHNKFVPSSGTTQLRRRGVRQAGFEIVMACHQKFWSRMSGSQNPGKELANGDKLLAEGSLSLYKSMMGILSCRPQVRYIVASDNYMLPLVSIAQHMFVKVQLIILEGTTP